MRGILQTGYQNPIPGILAHMECREISQTGNYSSGLQKAARTSPRGRHSVVTSERWYGVNSNARSGDDVARLPRRHAPEWQVCRKTRGENIIGAVNECKRESCSKF